MRWRAGPPGSGFPAAAWLEPLAPRDLALVCAVALALRLLAAYLIPFGVGGPDPNCAPDET